MLASTSLASLLRCLHDSGLLRCRFLVVPPFALKSFPLPTLGRTEEQDAIMTSPAEFSRSMLHDLHQNADLVAIS